MISDAKIVIIGAISVGKSCIAKRFVSDEFDQYHESTVGALFSQKTHQYSPGKKIKFQIWDTAGQQKYKAIARIYYKDARSAIVVYDVNSRQSYDAMKVWVSQLNENGPKNIAVVGNKIDLMKDKQQVPYIEAKQYANKLGAIFKYTSAKQNKGIDQLFSAIAQRLQASQNSSTLNKSGTKIVNQQKKAKKKDSEGCC